MTADTMVIQDPTVDTLVPEAEIYQQLLPLKGAKIIELGCGGARHTRHIAETHGPESIMACEVDQEQLQKNLAMDRLPNLHFVHAGAEAIPAENASVDIVIMFKSLHHVPVDSMDTALREIARVLRPGGLAYISEPVYAGDFNEILRLFHDEGPVRHAAFQAVRTSVAEGVMELAEQRFFNTPNHFENFADFEQRILKATHTQHRLSPELYATVQERFEEHMSDDGAYFEMPIRVDLLRRPAL